MCYLIENQMNLVKSAEDLFIQYLQRGPFGGIFSQFLDLWSTTLKYP